MHYGNRFYELEEKDLRLLEAESDIAQIVANLTKSGIHLTSVEIKDMTLIGLGLMPEDEFIEKHINLFSRCAHLNARR